MAADFIYHIDADRSQFAKSTNKGSSVLRRIFLAIVVTGMGIEFSTGRVRCRADEIDFSKVKEPELAKELQDRFESDQAIRQKFTDFYLEHKIRDEDRDLANLKPPAADELKALGEQMQEEDTKNRLWLKEVVRKQGWPGRTLVGAQAAIYAWCLVQHADSDREFQRDCLAKMEALPKGEVRAVDIAYLTDRILVGTGKKQKFGSQLLMKDGKLIPNPIENEEQVDVRRKEYGMEPLADYLKMSVKIYGLSKDEEDN